MRIDYVARSNSSLAFPVIMCVWCEDVGRRVLWQLIKFVKKSHYTSRSIYLQLRQLDFIFCLEALIPANDHVGRLSFADGLYMYVPI